MATTDPTDSLTNDTVDGGNSDYLVKFTCTDSVVPWEAPRSGIYRLEVRGGVGGDSASHEKGDADEEEIDTYSEGAPGGYAWGNVNLNKGDILYICVGGNANNEIGGYNGGGNGGNGNNNQDGWLGSRHYGGGGGATHIALNSNRGLLQNYENHKSEILIAGAGGGGGFSYASEARHGFPGGGLDGGSPVYLPDTVGIKNLNECPDRRNTMGGHQDCGGYFWNFKTVENEDTGNIEDIYYNGEDHTAPHCGSFGKSADSPGAAGGAGWYGGAGCGENAPQYGLSPYQAGAGGSCYFGGCLEGGTAAGPSCRYADSQMYGQMFASGIERKRQLYAPYAKITFVKPSLLSNLYFNGVQVQEVFFNQTHCTRVVADNVTVFDRGR